MSVAKQVLIFRCLEVSNVCCKESSVVWEASVVHCKKVSVALSCPLPLCVDRCPLFGGYPTNCLSLGVSVAGCCHVNGTALYLYQDIQTKKIQEDF